MLLWWSLQYNEHVQLASVLGQRVMTICDTIYYDSEIWNTLYATVGGSLWKLRISTCALWQQGSYVKGYSSYLRLSMNHI